MNFKSFNTEFIKNKAIELTDKGLEFLSSFSGDPSFFIWTYHSRACHG